MPEINIDRVTDLSMKEDRGAVVSLSRTVRIIFKPAEISALRAPNGGSVLAAALQVCDDNGLTPMSRPGGAPLHPTDRFAALVLVRRSPAVAENDPCCVDVKLEYEHIMDGHNQMLRVPTMPPPHVVFAEGKCSMREKQTNSYYPRGNKSLDKKLILVAHQFPLNSGIPTNNFHPDYPRVVFQGGEVKIPFPESNVKIQGIIYTEKPVMVARSMVAKINQKFWLAEPPGHWICSECTWKVLETNYNNTTKPTYKFGFEFQHNSDGWDPVVAFKDKRTGLIPADVVKGVVGPEVLDENNPPDDEGVLNMQFIQMRRPGGLENDIIQVRIPAGYWQVPALEPKDFDAFFAAQIVGTGIQVA